MSISKVSGKTASAVEQAKPKAESRQVKGAFRDAMKSAEVREHTKLAEIQKTSSEKQEVEKENVAKQEVEGDVEERVKLEAHPEADSGVEDTKPARVQEEPEDELKTRESEEELTEISGEQAPPDELMAAGLQTMNNGVAVGAQQEVQTSTGPEARHEVVQKLIETMVSGGQLGEDSKGRKVMMMDVTCPGRGTVRVRLWKKEDGIELRMRADNPELKSLLLLGRADLQSSAKEKGVNFSKIEVAE